MKPFLPLLAACLLGWGAHALAQAPASSLTPATPTATASSTQVVPSAMQVRVWASTCMACHGTHGRAQPGMASIAGLSRAELISAMQEYRSGQRTASIMHHHMRGYNDVQIAAIASYFAALPR